MESFLLQPGEAIYGLREKFSAFDRVGQNIGIWDCEGIGNTSWRAHKHVPFFLSTRGYGVFDNESRPIQFWVVTRKARETVLAVEYGLIDYHFFSGIPKETLEVYTSLTCNPPCFPDGLSGIGWVVSVTATRR